MFQRYFLATLLFAFFHLCSSAQVSVQFFPEVHGRTVDGLFNARIINSANQASVKLTITVSEQKAGKILTIQTQAFNLLRGINSIPTSAVKSASVQQGQGDVSRLVQQNGIFPQGNYEYSFVVTDLVSVSNNYYEQEFDYELTPAAPLNLIEPYNEDKICDRKPVLSWQPYVPYISGLQYQVQMAEIKNHQNAVEALNYNIPVINQRGIVQTMVPYPSISKDLEKGKKYAWQVTAYKNETVLNRSEVWEFMVDCKDSAAAPVAEDSGYRDIEDLAKGNYYVANGYISFSIVNSYLSQALTYSVVCLTDQKVKPKRLPKIKLTSGQNKIKIDLTANSSFKDGYSYVLQVILPDGSSKALRFIYKFLL